MIEICLAQIDTTVPITYLDAWAHWLAGDDIGKRVLWKLPIFWWARLAKIVGLAGGLLIVADILGATKVRSLSRSIKDTVNLESVFAYSGSCFKFVGKLMTASAFRRDGWISFSIAAHAASFLSAFYWADLASQHNQGFGTVFGMAYCFTYFFIAILLPMILGIAILGITIPVSLFTLLIEILANGIDNPRVERRIQIFSVILLLISFHFDFLAS